ncbi:MAG TPA: sulfite exporter TauE/SafE family protein, partial [Pseudomonadales bacterium]|nr:sulfite exporter TauE/SafE family protein [Pseudomonadales bacterium]
MNCALDFYSALLLGLASSLHCVGMCGGIVALFASAMPASQNSFGQRLLLHFSFSLGRVFTYTLFGLFVGVFSYFLLNHLMPQWASRLRLFSGIIIILFGLHLSGYLLPLNSLEAIGKPVWRYLSPKLKRFLPINVWYKALPAGVVWGFLPCGMVYSTLLVAMTAGSALASAKIMLGFGFGTIPLLLVSGLALQGLQNLLRKTAFRLGVASF